MSFFTSEAGAVGLAALAGAAGVGAGAPAWAKEVAAMPAVIRVRTIFLNIVNLLEGCCSVSFQSPLLAAWYE
jgi:hypothetical protein